MSKRVQTIKCYVIQNITVISNCFDEDYVHWSSDLTDEQQKEKAIKLKQSFEERYIDEKFRIILREEFEEVIDC